jgi:hypothetical protein
MSQSSLSDSETDVVRWQDETEEEDDSPSSRRDQQRRASADLLSSPASRPEWHRHGSEGVEPVAGKAIPNSPLPPTLTSPSAAVSVLASQSSFHLVQSPTAPVSPSADKTLPCPQASLLRTWYGWVSYCTLSWLTPLICLGMKRTLRLADIWDCFTEDKSNQSWHAFQPHWERAKERAKTTGEAPYLLGALARMVGWQLLFAQLLYAWVPTDQLLGPQFLNHLVIYTLDIQFQSVAPWEGYKWALLMVLSSLATALSNSLSIHLSQRIFLRLRCVLTLLIYRKALRIPSKNRADGRINNLMSQSRTRSIHSFNTHKQQQQQHTSHQRLTHSACLLLCSCCAVC